jgi:hypothetical protein
MLVNVYYSNIIYFTMCVRVYCVCAGQQCDGAPPWDHVGGAHRSHGQNTAQHSKHVS